MKTLTELRKDIEKIDTQIIKKLALREKKVKQIGEIKKASGTKVKDLAREKKLAKLYESLSEEYDLSPVLVKKLFKLIISHSRSVQKS